MRKNLLFIGVAIAGGLIAYSQKPTIVYTSIVAKDVGNQFIPVNLSNRGVLSGQWRCVGSPDTCLFVLNDGIAHIPPYGRHEVHFDPGVTSPYGSYVENDW